MIAAENAGTTGTARHHTQAAGRCQDRRAKQTIQPPTPPIHAHRMTLARVARGLPLSNHPTCALRYVLPEAKKVLLRVSRRCALMSLQGMVAVYCVEAIRHASSY